jgi:hypothetical protein
LASKRYACSWRPEQLPAFSVLNHVDDADVEEVLRGNLRGLAFTPK